MSDHFDMLDSSPVAGEESAIGRFAGWLLGLIGGNRGGLGLFAERLTAVFQPGYEVLHPEGGVWYATLDAIDPADNQVAALLRLSTQRHEQSADLRRGMVDVEEEEHEIPTAAPQGSSADEDLLLTYSFPLVIALDRNLELFREFAANELLRLRAASHQGVAWQPTAAETASA